jgi:hypothetical protein
MQHFHQMIASQDGVTAGVITMLNFQAQLLLSQCGSAT